MGLQIMNPPQTKGEQVENSQEKGSNDETDINDG